MDNEQGNAPVIPAGTEKTVFGTASFIPTGQAVRSPAGKPAAEVQQPDPSIQAAELEREVGIEMTPSQSATTFEDLAQKKGFQSPDELARSYVELEQHNKKVEMSFAELAKIREDGLQRSPESAIPKQVDTQEQAVQIVENLIKKHTQPLENRIQLQDLFSRHNDAIQYAEGMAKAIKENPGISWDGAYKIAKFDTLQQSAKEEGKKEAYQNIQNKQNVIVGASRPTAAKSERSLQDLVADKNVPFKEVQKILQERFGHRES